MAQLLGGRLIIKDEPEWSEDREGWDILRHRRVVRATSPTLALLAARFTLGSNPTLFGAGQMICMTRSAKLDRAPYYVCEAEYKGIAGAKPYKRTYRSFPNQARGTVGRFDSYGVPYTQEVEINDARVGITVQYVAQVAPPMNWVGSNAFPWGGSVSVPAPKWTGLRNPLEIIPAGWVLDGLESEHLAGSTMCLVRADFVYYQQYEPGSQSS